MLLPNLFLQCQFDQCLTIIKIVNIECRRQWIQVYNSCAVILNIDRLNYVTQPLLGMQNLIAI